MSRSRPNILWIMGDEFRTDSLSCYGTPFPQVVTPHIDGIAAQGVRFTNCFCNSPICVPSRTSEMTATPPETTGVYGNEGSWASFRYDRDLITFPEHFARAGWQTVNFGKTHLPVALKPWQEDIHDGADLKNFYDGTDAADLTDEVYTPTLKAAIAGTWPDTVDFPGSRVTRNAVRWLESAAASEAPFLMRASYLQPHSPVLPPRRYGELYADLPWPDAIGPDRPGSAFESEFVRVLRADALSGPQVRRVHSDYYGLVRWLDDQVGQLMAALRKSGLADDTIVVLEADHGVSLGERGRLQKHTFFPEVHRVPRLIAFPGRLPPGQVRADLCESLDLARSLCGLAGIAPAASFQGRDLFSTAAPPEHVFSTVGFGDVNSRALPNQVVGIWADGSGWPRRACVRTDRYRLDLTVRHNGRATGPGDEDPYLADSAIDPAEAVNRAGDPRYASVLAHLRALLREHCDRGHDPGPIPLFSAAERGIN